MPKRAAEASRELKRLEEARQEQRRSMMRAMLEACGELGYAKVRVRDVTDRYGSHRGQFHSHFSNLEECFEAAYAVEADALAERILKRGAGEDSWRRGFGGALRELAACAQERPAVLRALLVSVQIAGEHTRERRREILQRLSRALDTARREASPRHSPPPSTALFMVGAIEAAVISTLAENEPESFFEVVPELERMVFAAYFGD